MLEIGKQMRLSDVKKNNILSSTNNDYFRRLTKELEDSVSMIKDSF